MKIEKKWWKESVVYQIYPRSFKDSNGDGIGDINGIIEKLDYLKELGIDVIWLSPVYESPNDDNGYDISNYREIMKEFGTMEDCHRLIEEAHNRGIKLVMDLVVNHTSDEHPWFVESRKSLDNPYRDYYIWRPARDGKEPSNWGSCFSGSAWQYDPQTDRYYLHLFSRKQPDLNWDNPKVREEVYDMMNWWLDQGIDGFRMDVISLISKDPSFADGPEEMNGYTSFNIAANGPRVHEYIQEMRRKVLDGRDTLTVGECSGTTLEEAQKYASGDGKELNMVFQFEHMDVDADSGNKWSEKKIDLREMKQVMTKWQKGLDGISWNSLFWENHDQPRSVTRYGNDKEYREVSAKMLATCLYMMQGTPYIYQGQELGMTNAPFGEISDFRDLDSVNAYRELTEKGIYTKEEMLKRLRYKSRDNARTPFQWSDAPNGGFTDGTPWIMVNPNYKTINAEEQRKRPDSVFSYYKQLIRVRRANDCIIYGTYDLLEPKDKDLYIYERSSDTEKILVICNFSKESREYHLPGEWKNSEYTLLLGNYGDRNCPHHPVLRPYEAIVYKRTYKDHE